MNAFAKLTAAKAINSTIVTLASLVVFALAYAAAVSMGGADNFAQLCAVVTAWTAPLVALCSIGCTIHHLTAIKNA